MNDGIVVDAVSAPYYSAAVVCRSPRKAEPRRQVIVIAIVEFRIRIDSRSKEPSRSRIIPEAMGGIRQHSVEFISLPEVEHQPLVHLPIVLGEEAIVGSSLRSAKAPEMYQG